MISRDWDTHQGVLADIMRNIQERIEPTLSIAEIDFKSAWLRTQGSTRELSPPPIERTDGWLKRFRTRNTKKTCLRQSVLRVRCLTHQLLNTHNLQLKCRAL